MAKAQIKLLNGTEVQIEGTPKEINELLKFYSDQKTSNIRTSGSKNKQSKGNKKNKKIINGPTELIKGLIEEGYFKGQKRTLSDVQKKLEERGHIYAQTSLSMPLIRLTRGRDLRRIKDKKGWIYVI